MKVELSNVLVLLLLLTQLGLLAFSQPSVSMTFDEPLHISSGYSKITTGDFRMNTEHPPLMHLLEGLPLLLLKPKLDISHESWTRKNMPEFARRFFFVDNKNPRQMLAYSRIPIIILTVALGWMLFAWTKALYGKTAGLIALTLYSFEPNILGHGILATTDMGFAFFSFLAMFCYWRFFKNPTPATLFIAAFTMGIAQLTKYTAIFLFPIYFLIIILSSTHKNYKYHLLSFAVIILVSVLIINAAYLFHQTGMPIKTAMLADTTLDKELYSPEKIFSSPIMSLAAEIPSPLPYYYVKGLGFVLNEGRNPSPNIIFGKMYEQGAWHYFAAAFLVKTTMALIALLLFAFLPQQHKTKDWQFLAIPIVVLLFVMSSATKQLGIRYILAVFPFLIALISGRIINAKAARLRTFQYLIGVILVLHAASSLAFFPDYISYYNEFVGKEGWKYFTDSNTDWGQDFDKLLSHTKKHPEIKVQYFGTNDVEFYGLNKVESCEPGLLAVSVREATHNLTWLKNQTPVDRIGNSIMVYNITQCDRKLF